MTYFPCDIPHMSHDELEENGINIPKDECGVEMNDGLKPCPFCGRKANFTYDVETLAPTGIQCVTCHMIVRFSRIKPPRKREPYERVIKELVTAWNRREGED